MIGQQTTGNVEYNIDDIFQTYYPRLILFAYKILQNRADSEEVVQEVFIRFWQNVDLSKIEYSMKGYLFRSVFNGCIDLQRKLQKRNKDTKQVEAEDLVIPFHDSILAQELEDAINKSISQLPPRCREIFVLSRNKKMAYSEIAAELNISRKTVEIQVSRALKQMRKDLIEYLPSLFF